MVGKDQSKDIFISYTQADRPVAEWAAGVLEEEGYTVFVRGWDVLPGDNWVSVVNRGLAQARHVLPIISSEYLRSVAQIESLAALADDPAGSRRTLIPVLVENCRLPPLLAQLGPIDLTRRLRPDEARRILVDGLVGMRDVRRTAWEAGRPSHGDTRSLPVRRPPPGLTPVALGAAILLALAGAAFYGMGRPALTQAYLAALAALAILIPIVATAAPRDNRTDAEVAEQLARRVRDQLLAERRRLDLNLDRITVRGVPAAADLFDAWPVLVSMAGRGRRFGGGTGAPWAAGLPGLINMEDLVHVVLQDVPTQRAVLLGEPGSGKTVALISFVLNALEDRFEGDPVPMLVPLGSWNPDQQSLTAWLVEWLVTSYPILGARSRGATARTRAAALLAEDMIMPVLDGLDEISPSLRAKAVHEVNRAFRPGQPLLLSARKREYINLSLPGRSDPVTVRAAAGIELTSVASHDVKVYLKQRAGPAARTWEPLAAELDDIGSVVGRAFGTPLFAGLAARIYSPGPTAEDHAGPEELLQGDVLPTVEAVRDHLLDKFVRVVYAPSAPEELPRWPEEKVQRWLAFLARITERHGVDIRWWKLSRTLRPGPGRLLFGVLFGLAVGVPAGISFGVGIEVNNSISRGPRAGVRAGFALVVLAGLVGWLTVRTVQAEPTSRPHWTSLDVRWFVPPVLIGIVGLPMVASLAHAAESLAVSSSTGALCGAVAGIALGRRGRPADVDRVATPGVLLRQDAAAFRALVVSGGIGAGVTVGVAMGLTERSNGPVAVVIVGFTTAVAASVGGGLLVGLTRAAWGWFSFARTCLVLGGWLPWHLMAFLEDAHARGIIRQVGAVYQFRHLELQRRLADRSVVGSTAPSLRESLALMILEPP